LSHAIPVHESILLGTLGATGRRSKRFASNVLHTNMQVWALGRGFAEALRKFNRFVDTRLSRKQE
jgi:hypothetical protein